MNNGGVRQGAGRKSKADEEKVNIIFSNALKDLYKTSTDDQAKQKFIKEVLMESQRGQLFIAEHLFGKPKDIVENHNFEAGKLTDEEIKRIKNNLIDAY